MFDPREEIQVIGVDLGEDVSWQEKVLVNDILTRLNKQLTLKNRYKETLKENIKLQKELLDYKYKDLVEKVKE